MKKLTTIAAAIAMFASPLFAQDVNQRETCEIVGTLGEYVAIGRDLGFTKVDAVKNLLMVLPENYVVELIPMVDEIYATDASPVLIGAAVFDTCMEIES